MFYDRNFLKKTYHVAAFSLTLHECCSFPSYFDQLVKEFLKNKHADEPWLKYREPKYHQNQILN